MSRFIFLAFVVFCFADIENTEDTEEIEMSPCIGGRRFSVPPPNGECQLDQECTSICTATCESSYLPNTKTAKCRHTKKTSNKKQSYGHSKTKSICDCCCGTYPCPDIRLTNSQCRTSLDCNMACAGCRSPSCIINAGFRSGSCGCCDCNCLLVEKGTFDFCETVCILVCDFGLASSAPAPGGNCQCCCSGGKKRDIEEIERIGSKESRVGLLAVPPDQNCEEACNRVCKKNGGKQISGKCDLMGKKYPTCVCEFSTAQQADTYMTSLESARKLGESFGITSLSQLDTGFPLMQSFMNLIPPSMDPVYYYLGEKKH